MGGSNDPNTIELKTADATRAWRNAMPTLPSTHAETKHPARMKRRLLDRRLQGLRLEGHAQVAMMFIAS
jgi:hypothetical protein